MGRNKQMEKMCVHNRESNIYSTNVILLLANELGEENIYEVYIDINYRKAGPQQPGCTRIRGAFPRIDLWCVMGEEVGNGSGER